MTARKAARAPRLETDGRKLALALPFGIAFGFLLQKAGVAKFDLLVGVLLLENVVVIQVMLSAILVGMIGTYLLRRAGRIELHVHATAYGPNAIGGLIFGLGFGLLAYCPGTDAAAVGQGNFDALVGVLGMVCGSYLYALASRRLSTTVERWGRRGELTVPGLLGLPEGIVVGVAAGLIVAVLAGLDRFAGA